MFSKASMTNHHKHIIRKCFIGRLKIKFKEINFYLRNIFRLLALLLSLFYLIKIIERNVKIFQKTFFLTDKHLKRYFYYSINI